ncbi:MAG: RdgB/HAM1 family non-canonical purine NTP pyrophosphatase [Ignavibacteria bacterium]
MKILIASNNAHKIEELSGIFTGFSVPVMLISQRDFFGNESPDIEETGLTLQENALIKAKALFALTQMPVISDDTGLEVYALNNAPGVYSARYAGQHGNDKANREKLLHELGNHDNRKARFRTVLHFMSHESSFSAEGICEGRIAKEEAGNHGFGYDSIFIPDGEILTFAEMDPFKKNAMSHRAKAGIELGRMVAEFVQSRNKNE